MKCFLMSLIVMASVFANADEVEGVWAFSGVGCRDEHSLSYKSHRTKPASSNTAGLSEATLYLRGNQAEMVVVLNGSREETGTVSYSVKGNEIIFRFDKKKDSVFLVDNRIIVISDDEEDMRNCRRGEVFVFVLGKVE